MNPGHLKEHSPLISGSACTAKRAIDIVGAVLGLVVFAPVMPFIALAIRLESSGPVLFTQKRVGLGGRVYSMYKFRSMVAGAERMLDDLVDVDALEEPVFKLQDDPRVTRVGRFLRRWSLDELPQFCNVLRGDMSLVGPRPEEVRIVACYNSWHKKRLLAKPGMTGPAQVSGRGDLTLSERVHLEIDYIDNYSLARDIEILVETIPVVLQGDGSY